MLNGSAPPHWLVALSWISICISLATAIWIALHVLARNRQPMAVMNFVWPITALYFGPLAIPVYLQLGTEKTGNMPLWKAAFKGDTHCGAGCTLGDLAGEGLVFGFGLKFAGSIMWTGVAVDFAFAYLLGLVFQYYATAPMRHISGWDGLKAAAKADTLSLVAFEAGMLVWMALSGRILFQPRLQPNQATFWLSMQIAMIVGFAVALPVNAWLIRCGIKEAM